MFLRKDRNPDLKKTFLRDSHWRCVEWFAVFLLSLLLFLNICLLINFIHESVICRVYRSLRPRPFIWFKLNEVIRVWLSFVFMPWEEIAYLVNLRHYSKKMAVYEWEIRGFIVAEFSVQSLDVRRNCTWSKRGHQLIEKFWNVKDGEDV